MMGESLGSMNAKELKNLESKLEKGISRIRSKKVIINNYFLLFFKDSWFCIYWCDESCILLILPFLFACTTSEWAVICWNWIHAEEG